MFKKIRIRMFRNLVEEITEIFFEASKFGNNGNNKKGRTCYNCEKKGHYKRECRFVKKQSREEPNIIVQNSNKTNLVEQEPTELIACFLNCRLEC